MDPNADANADANAADGEVELGGNITFTFGADMMLSDEVVGSMVFRSRKFFICEKKELVPGADEVEKYVCFQSSETNKRFALGKVCGKTTKYAQFSRLRNHIRIEHVDLKVNESGPDRFEVLYRLETLARSAGVDEKMAAIHMASYLLRVGGEKRKRDEEEEEDEEKDRDGDEEDERKEEDGGDQMDVSAHFDFTKLSGAEEEEEGTAEPPRKKGRAGRCDYCLQEFMGQRDLRDHLWADHDGATLWPCEDCDFFLSSKQKLDEHMETQKHKSKLEENEQGKEEEEKQEEEGDKQEVEKQEGENKQTEEEGDKQEVRSTVLWVCHLFVDVFCSRLKRLRTNRLRGGAFLLSKLHFVQDCPRYIT